MITAKHVLDYLIMEQAYLKELVEEQGDSEFNLGRLQSMERLLYGINSQTALYPFNHNSLNTVTNEYSVCEDRNDAYSNGYKDALDNIMKVLGITQLKQLK